MADDVGNRLKQLFEDPEFEVEAVFAKALSRNDDSGRHGVYVPQDVYSLFPPLAAELAARVHNPRTQVQTLWWDAGRWIERVSHWTHYEDYPERRLTSLNPQVLNAPNPRVLLMAKQMGAYRYRCLVVTPADALLWPLALAFLGTETFAEGAYRLASPDKTDVEIGANGAELLSELRRVARAGFWPTQLVGDPGVGVTLEIALGLKPNSARQADYRGIELKSARLKDRGDRRVSLFSRTPEWDGISAMQLVHDHGYVDSDGQLALRTSVYGHRESASGWQLLVLRDERRLYAFHNGEPVVWWPFERLTDGLSKHSAAAVVYAETRGVGAHEAYRYVRVTFAQDPSVDRLLQLIEDGRVCVDFTLHVTESGRTRDHGYLFRIHEPSFARLYRVLHTFPLTEDAG